MARPEFDGVGVELDRPINDVATGFLIAEDVAEWVLYDYSNVIGVEVVAELLGHDQDGVQQLLNLGVVSLRLV